MTNKANFWFFIASKLKIDSELDLIRLFVSHFTKHNSKILVKKNGKSNSEIFTHNGHQPLIVRLKAQLSTESASSKQLSRVFFCDKQGKFLVFDSFQAQNRFRTRLN